MPDIQWFPAYRDEFAGGLYPFGDQSTLVSDGGLIALTPGMLVDAVIYPAGGGANARIASIVAGSDTTTIVIGDDDSESTCSAAFDPLTPPEFLQLLDAYGRAAGTLVLDPVAMAGAQTWPIGTYTFRYPAAVFAARCCFPSTNIGVRSLLVDGVAIDGDVWFIGENGIVLSSSSSSSGGNIRVDAVGDPMSARSAADNLGGFTTPRFVRQLRVQDDIGNIVPLDPDSRGNVQVIGANTSTNGTALRFITGSPTVTFKVAGKTILG